MPKHLEALKKYIVLISEWKIISNICLNCFWCIQMQFCPKIHFKIFLTRPEHSFLKVLFQVHLNMEIYLQCIFQRQINRKLKKITTIPENVAFIGTQKLVKWLSKIWVTTITKVTTTNQWPLTTNMKPGLRKGQ